MKTKMPVSLLLALIMLSANTIAHADGGENKSETTEEKKSEATKKFAGINFGVGLTLTLDTGSHERVDSAEIVDGVVRVTEESNDVPRIMLETHYFFMPETNFLGMKNVKSKEWGLGPFVGIQNGSDEIIQAIGAGVMLGFRRNEEAKDSFNIGFGFVVDPSVQILGDGIEENEPLPAGETQIRYKETSQWGVLLVVSYTF